MELHYSNLNANEKAEMYNDKVRAEVTRCTGLGLGSGLGPPTDLFSAYLSTYSLVRSEVELGAWAGLGGESEYVEAPVSDGQGHMTYKMHQPNSNPKLGRNPTPNQVRRYGQGLIFRLRPGGALYVFEIMYLINVLVAGAVGLAVVKVLMDVIVKYLLPGGVSRLMNSKKSEIVSKANRIDRPTLDFTRASTQRR
eukprot:scaffold95317_cov68-Phaeocystis_antarctica.AAC.2